MQIDQVVEKLLGIISQEIGHDIQENLAFGYAVDVLFPEVNIIYYALASKLRFYCVENWLPAALNSVHYEGM